MKIKPEDLIIRYMETYRSKGGMWTGRMSQGVTVYHKPTQIEISYDKERSQHKNRHICLVIVEDLLTDVIEGDIVVTKKGIGEVIGSDNFDTVTVKLGDGTLYEEYEDRVFHTEEAYNYIKESVLKESMETLEKEFEIKRKELIKEWRY